MISLVKSTFNTISLVNETAAIIQKILQLFIPIPLILNENMKYEKHPEFQQIKYLRFHYFNSHLCSIRTLPWHVGKILVYFACIVSVLHLWCFIHNPNLANVLEVVTEVAVLAITFEGAVASYTLETFTSEIAFIANEIGRIANNILIFGIIL